MLVHLSSTVNLAAESTWPDWRRLRTTSRQLGRDVIQKQQTTEKAMYTCKNITPSGQGWPSILQVGPRVKCTHITLWLCNQSTALTSNIVSALGLTWIRLMYAQEEQHLWEGPKQHYINTYIQTNKHIHTHAIYLLDTSHCNLLSVCVSLALLVHCQVLSVSSSPQFLLLLDKLC